MAIIIVNVKNIGGRCINEVIVVHKIISIFGVPVFIGNRCPHCKALINEKAKYCNNCGTQIYVTDK